MRSLVILCFLFTAIPCRAELPNEADQAYREQVVLLFRANPQFDENFRFNLKFYLAVQLRDRLGGIANFEILDLAAKPEKDWTDLEKNLLKTGPSALEGPVLTSPDKTHVFWIESSDLKIRVRGRQRDGDTGFCSPVRESSLADRSTLLEHLFDDIVKDFGFTGTFTSSGENVQVAWKAGRRGTTLGDWVRPGDVLKVIQIRREGAKGMRANLADCDDVVLQVAGEMADGSSACRLYRQFVGGLPPERGGVLGYRCIRLATTTAQVKLKLVDPKGQALRQVGLQVRIKDNGFAEAGQERDLAQPNNGVFASRDPIKNLAFVRVDIGDRALARIPLPITGDGLVIRSVNIEAGAETKDRLIAQNGYLLQRVNDSRIVQGFCLQQLSKLVGDGKIDQACELARRTIVRIDEDIVQLRADFTKFKDQVIEAKLNVAGFTDLLDKRVRALEQSRSQLSAYIQKLDDAAQAANTPEAKERQNKINAKILGIDSALQQANIDEALKLYDEAIALFEENTPAKQEVQRRRDQLKGQWETKSDAHAKARKYIYNTWAKSSNFDELKSNLTEVRRAFEICRQANDRYSLVKLNQLSPVLEKLLYDEIEKLKEHAGEESTLKRFDTMSVFRNDLIAFHNEVVEALRAFAK